MSSQKIIPLVQEGQSPHNHEICSSLRSVIRYIRESHEGLVHFSQHLIPHGINSCLNVPDTMPKELLKWMILIRLMNRDEMMILRFSNWISGFVERGLVPLELWLDLDQALQAGAEHPISSD